MTGTDGRPRRPNASRARSGPAAGWICAAVIALGLACRPATEDAPRKSNRGAQAGARVVVAARWDTLWTRGGTAQDDTLLLMPWAVAADSERVYVLDVAGYRVVAFRADDGSVAWTFGRKGGGPGEFYAPTALATMPGGGIAIADPRNGRITVLNASGGIDREIALRDVADVRSLCALRDGRLLLSTLGDDRPVALLSAEGTVARRFALPWPDLAHVPPIVRQARLAPTQDRSGCVLALELGLGFAIFDGRGFTDPHPYVEWFDLPDVEVRTRSGSRTQRILERRIAAYDVAVDRGEIAMAFEGTTGAARRLVDFYDAQSGHYLRTYMLSGPVNNLARHGRRYYVVSEHDGYPVLVAVKESAQADPPRRRAGGRTAKPRRGHRPRAAGSSRSVAVASRCAGC